MSSQRSNGSNTMQLDFEQLKLCGRKRELRSLIGSFENNAIQLNQQPNAQRAFVISGPPGCGKTKLIHAFRDEVTAQEALFLCGRCQEEEEDHFGGDMFLALTQALNELVDQLAKLDGLNNDCYWKNTITHYLNQQEIQMLGMICPQLTEWLLESVDQHSSTNQRTSSTKPHRKSLGDISVSSEDASKALDCLEATLIQQSAFVPAHESDAGPFLGAMASVEDSKVISSVSNCAREFSGSIVLTTDWRCKQLGLVCRSLFHAVSQRIPIVLCQDNLQEAHPDYWSVISETLADESILNFMFVGIDRSDCSEGTDSDSCLYKRTASVVRGGAVTRIELRNLELSGIEELLLMLVGRSKEEGRLKELARVLQRKTAGNPAVLVNFLQLLEEKNLIYWSALEGTWEWDSERIVCETSLADDLVEGVTLKIRKLSPELVETLAEAATIGTTEIDFRVLNQIRQLQSADSLRQELATLVQKGLLESINEDSFIFSHPRIRKQAKILMNRDNMTEFHALAGKALMEKARSGEVAEKQKVQQLILLATSHLNLCPPGNDAERLNLLQLNLDAAQISVVVFALGPAVEFLQKSREIARSLGGWENRNLMLRMELFCIQVLHCSGRHEDCASLADEVIEKTGWMDSLPALRYKASSFLELGRTVEAKEIIHKTLQQLGFPYPQAGRVGAKLSTVKDLLKVKASSYFQNPKKLLDLPRTNEPRVLAAMEFFWILFKTALIGADSEVQIRVSLCWIRITLKYGFTPLAPIAITTLAVLHAEMKNYDAAQEVADIALKMADSVGSECRSTVLSAVAFFCTHWKHSLTHSLDMAVKAKEAILEVGFTPVLYFACVTYTTTYIAAGLPLEPLLQDALKLNSFLGSLRHHQIQDSLEIPVQFISNIMGRNECPTELRGEIISDHKLQHHSTNQNINERTRGVICYYRMILGYFFDDIELAVSMSRQLYSVMQEGSTVFLPVRFFFQGMVAFAQARTSSGRTAARAMKKARKCLRRINRMASRDCVNVCHYVLLLKAELLSLQRNPDRAKVQHAYDRAISCCGRLGVTHMQAIGNERAAAYFSSLGDESWACVYMNRAWKLYTLWGAHGKAAQLQSKYPHLLASSSESELYLGSTVKGRERMGDVPGRLNTSRISLV